MLGLGIFLYVVGIVTGLTAIAKTVNYGISPSALGWSTYGGLALALIGVILIG